MVRYSDVTTNNASNNNRRQSNASEKSDVNNNEQHEVPADSLKPPPASCPLSAIHHLTHNGPIKITNLSSSKQVVDKLHQRTKVSFDVYSFLKI